MVSCSQKEGVLPVRGEHKVTPSVHIFPFTFGHGRRGGRGDLEILKLDLLLVWS